MRAVGGAHQLADAAAGSYLMMRDAGCPSGITSAYRSAAEQARLRARYLSDPKRWPYARPVGQSKHQDGTALDLPVGPELWVRANPQFGWRFTDPNERWHAEYFPALDIAPRHTPPEDNTMSTQDIAYLDARIEKVLAWVSDVGSRVDRINTGVTDRRLFIYVHHREAVYEAAVQAGTVAHVLNSDDLSTRQGVLSELGIPWSWWTGGPDGSPQVDNLEAFGVVTRWAPGHAPAADDVAL